MHKLLVIILSFLSAVTVMAQNDAFEEINTEVQENITEPQYNFAPDEGSPGVEVAPLAVNSKDQDVPLQPTVQEKVDIQLTQPENSDNND